MFLLLSNFMLLLVQIEEVLLGNFIFEYCFYMLIFSNLLFLGFWNYFLCYYLNNIIIFKKIYL